VLKNVISMSTNKPEDEVKTTVRTHSKYNIYIDIQIIVLTIFAFFCVVK